MVEWKKLGDICEKTSNIKWKDQADDKIYKYIDLSSVSLDSHKVIVTTDVCKQNAPSRAQQIVCANDILLGTTRPTLKRYCQIPSYLDKNICSTGFCIFRANKEYVLSRWLFHNIGSSKFWDYCELKQQGAGYPCLSNSDAFAYMIPIPSIEEQNRIVGILDTFTASIDNLKEQIAQRRKQYEYYRDQLLDLEGKEGVEMKLLSSISTIKVGPFGSLIHKKDYVSGGIPLVNPVQMNNGYIVRDDSFSVSEETAKLLESYTLYTGDVVFARRGEIGRCAIVTENESNFICGTGSLIVRFKDIINSKFMLFMFNTPYCKTYLLKSAVGGSMLNINCDIVGKMQIPVPPLSEQQRIVSILDTFEASIQNLEAQLSQRENQYDYYRNKLLTFE